MPGVFPTILTDESSEYFNKSLYPLVNKFERLLRKFLYLKVSQCDEQKFRSVISDIDQKDFGEIYTILFIDNNFRAAARDKIKKLNTRAEMYEAIDALQESTAWHILVGDEVLTIIKDNFDLLKEYRNDVMHAHNISWENIKKQKSYLLMQMMHLRWNSISYCNIPQLRSCLKRRHPPSMKK